jgi:serine/threonine protein kinase
VFIEENKNMNMKKIIKEWNSFVEKKTYKRVILNELKILSEEEIMDFPLSPEELEELRAWGDLQGEPRLLGTGTMGRAYQFNDKVLKLTQDYDEANAAANIAGKKNPYVYEVYKVAKRNPKFKEFKEYPLVITYKLVTFPQDGDELPDKQAQELIKSLYNSRDRIRMFWPTNFYDLFERLKETIRNNPEVVENSKDNPSNEPLIKTLCRMSGFKQEESEAIDLAWRYILGYYKKYPSYEVLLEMLNNKERLFKQMNELCSGLTFLKKNGIEFQDLKTTNVMRTEDDKLVIIDIGRSMVWDHQPIKQL